MRSIGEVMLFSDEMVDMMVVFGGADGGDYGDGLVVVEKMEEEGDGGGI